MIDLTQYRRRATHEVRIGACTIGGTHPVAVQSMTNTDTNDTEACAAQIERIDRAGGKIVRLTAQGRREGENLENIVRQLRADGFRQYTQPRGELCGSEIRRRGSPGGNQRDTRRNVSRGG